MIRAPIDKILPSFMPVIFERGIPGYISEELSPGETRIPLASLRPLLIASAFVGTSNHAAERGFDLDKVQELLSRSVLAIPGVNSSEAQQAIDLVHRFETFPIIRADHSLDDWLCEALWSAFQAAPYTYPSAMSKVISCALDIDGILQRAALEY